MQSEIRIGTSGWYYRHWLGNFYPAEMKLSRTFDYYTRRFNTVEINNSFYALPTDKTVVKWKESSPPKFLFAAKASRYLTHIKRLKDPAEPLARFFGVMRNLKEKLGPILFQFPGNWSLDYDRLSAFLGVLPRGLRCVFEFRAASSYPVVVLGDTETAGIVVNFARMIASSLRALSHAESRVMHFSK